MHINTPLGKIYLGINKNSISKVSYIPLHDDQFNTALFEEATQQITQYFGGRRQYFNLPITLKGTSFQRKVWHLIANIPYGLTKTYKQIAVELGKPEASRAVGNACNKNPIPIIIPCHRIIGSSGKLVGYNGGIDKKDFLLQLEQQYI